MQDIHDIRPPVPVGIDPMLIKMILIGAAVTALIAVALLLIRKWLENRTKDNHVKLLPQPPAPYDAALSALEQLEHAPDDDPRVFYFDLTMVLRRYMGRSFCAGAVEMTSQEFISFIRKAGLDEKLKSVIIEFYRGCDFYKYAGARARADQVQADINSVREIIVRVETCLKSDSEDKEGGK